MRATLARSAALIMAGLALGGCTVNLPGSQPTATVTQTTTVAPTAAPSAPAPSAPVAAPSQDYSWIPGVRARTTSYAALSDAQLYGQAQLFCATLSSAQTIYPNDDTAAMTFATNTAGEAATSAFGANGPADAGYMASQAVPVVCPENYQVFYDFVTR